MSSFYFSISLLIVLRNDILSVFPLKSSQNFKRAPETDICSLPGNEYIYIYILTHRGITPRVFRRKIMV